MAMSGGSLLRVKAGLRIVIDGEVKVRCCGDCDAGAGDWQSTDAATGRNRVKTASRIGHPQFTDAPLWERVASIFCILKSAMGKLAGAKRKKLAEGKAGCELRDDSSHQPRPGFPA
jgi:hypothetical protein